MCCSLVHMPHSIIGMDSFAALLPDEQLLRFIKIRCLFKTQIRFEQAEDHYVTMFGNSVSKE